ncbi:MAG: ABC transporter permease [Spirochaetales bacterium]|jgi:NitT/TauT family transport system permease protein|nr:ABC transporter permease [Spirochaetales bacterium]
MGKGIKTFIKNAAPKAFNFLLFLVIWQLIVVVFKIKVFILPSPIRVLQHLFYPPIAAKYNWWLHVGATFMEVIVSFVATAIAGIFIAVMICWSPVMNQLLSPIIILFNSLPKIALAPLFLVWFGYGFLPNILVAFMVAFFPVVINSAAGLMAVEEDLLDLVNYLNATKAQIFIKIRIPNSLPYIFAGLKISATMCVVGSIVGEFIAADKGLGYLLRDAQAFIDTPTMFACLFLLSIIGLALFFAIGQLERLVMPWNRRRES